MNDLEKQIFKSYNNKINDAYCKKCNDYYSHYHDPEIVDKVGPISYFHIGNNVEKRSEEIRLVFVGKTSWHEKTDLKSKDNDKGYEKKGNVYDASSFGKIGVSEYDSAFWKYIGDIIKSKEFENLNITMDNIAITNLVKCNLIDNSKDDKSKNVTDDFYFERCFPIFQEEIKLISPTHIIFFIGAGYDYILRDKNFGFDLFVDEKNTKGKIFDEDYKIEVFTKDGEKRKAWWWQRSFMKNDKKEMCFLRTRHPQGAPAGLKDAIIEWINNSNVV